MTNEKNDADLWEERPLLFVHGQAEGGRLMTAGEVARLTDVSARTLQHYDDIGLLCPRRSGEGVANNRKLYDEGDIDRLGRIIALKEYGLTLSEIKAVIDADDAVILAVLDEKLAALRRQEAKLRDLILFARMLSITGSNPVDGLVAGPAIVDDLADAARALPPYEHGRRWADELETPEEREVAFLALGKIVEDFASAGALAGFAAFERLVGLLSSWWDLYVHPCDDLGLLGWWALFEDERAIAAEVGRVGGEAMCANVEMAFLLVFLRRFMDEAAPLVRAIAQGEEAGGPTRWAGAAQPRASAPAARVAAEELAWLIGRMTGGFYLRKGPVPEAAGRAAYGRLCACVLDFAANALADGELMAFIDPEGGVGLDPAALPAAAIAVARAVEEGAGALPPDHWEGLRG